MHDLKHICSPPRNKTRQGLILFFLLALFLIPLALLLIREGASAYGSWREQSAIAKAAVHPHSSAELFSMASELLPAAQQRGNGLTATTPDGTVLHYSIIPGLQERIQRYLESYHVPYGIVVALEPASGRILAIAGHSSLMPDWPREAAYQLYPMASLFKMVTAASALENGKITPNTVMAFRGRPVSEAPSGWDPSPRGRNNQMDVSEAICKSCNPVYGRIASDLVGSAGLKATLTRFGFNTPLLPGLPVRISQAPTPTTERELRLLGAGLKHSLQVSPLHAAMITASIANNGVMMTPRLVDRISRGNRDQTLPPSREIRRVLAPQVADNLTHMLTGTVTKGTSRRAFRTSQGRQLLANVTVAAKTGSIDGNNPKGHYSWFAAFAPAERPKIALVALVINGDRWRIKASQVGEQALDAFFKADR